jgi:SAM-dependent methyltransferase
MEDRASNERGGGAPPAADQIVIQLLTGMWATQAVATAVRLGIPDRLAAGPGTPDEVAGAAGAHAGATRRLMRGLASLGVLAPAEGGRYALTAVGERLRGDAPGSLREMFVAETDEIHWRSWQKLFDSVRTGDPRPQQVFGMPAFDYYAAPPEEGAQFGRAMENVSNFAAAAVLEAYDFSGVKTLLDVGGGNGSFALAILGRHPNLQGVVFDLPYMEGPARERIAVAGVSGRCRFEAGSFFERVPAGADLQIMKFILHDWNDEESLRLLRRCREAIAPGGRLVVVETLVPEEIQPGLVHLMDLNMLVMTGGLERTAKEYAALLEQAGFRVSRVVATASPFSLVEAVPA